jgi:hypothetical protein
MVRRRASVISHGKCLPLLRTIFCRVPPHVEQTFLDQLIDVIIVTDHSADDCAQKRMMAAMQHRECRFIIVLNALHQLLVADFAAGSWGFRFELFGIEGVKHGVRFCLVGVVMPSPCQGAGYSGDAFP